jgi:hypothetical protein
MVLIKGLVAVISLPIARVRTPPRLGFSAPATRAGSTAHVKTKANDFGRNLNFMIASSAFS